MNRPGDPPPYRGATTPGAQRTWTQGRPTPTQARTAPRRAEAPPPRPEVRAHRALLLGIVVTLPLMAALWGFYRQQGGAPVWPTDLVERSSRGALLTQDGRVLAVGPADARRYPQGTLAGPLVGFVGALQPDGRFGLEGLEYTLDARLQAGTDVVLTIDSAIQAAAEAHLTEAVTRHAATSATAVVLEVGSGRVLAAASAPGFDPSAWRATQGDERRNLPLVHLYEPGSVMKPFVVAALLERGRLDPTERIPTPPTLAVGRHVFRDVVSHPDTLTAEDVLHYSSNTGTIELARRLGSDELYGALRDFGFGNGVDLGPVFTAEGVLRDSNGWVPQDHASIAIGQGVSVTNLQLAAAYAVIAQEGRYVPPRLIADDPGGEGYRVLTPATAATVRGMLRHTMEAGSLRASVIPGIPTGGKTGTADIYDPATGGYPAGRYALSFAGMFPIDDPQIVIVVTVHEPSQPATSTAVAAPLFQAIGADLVSQWALAPDGPAWARAGGRRNSAVPRRRVRRVA